MPRRGLGARGAIEGISVATGAAPCDGRSAGGGVIGVRQSASYVGAV